MDAGIQDVQKFKFIIYGIKANNAEMTIEKLSVINDKAYGGMATDFENYVSYLKNSVATNRTTHINLPDVGANP